jgi:hypothetical protein
MNKAKFTIEGYALEQRYVNELAKGDTIKADEDLGYILLPKEYANKNIACIITHQI